MIDKTDFLVIGSGLAGLYYALEVAEHGDVTVVTKRDAGESNTALAQGGVASVLDGDDSFAAHVGDTRRVGAGLCHEEIVAGVVRDGPKHIRRLLELGVDFSRDENGDLSLGREGGHSHRRVAHVDDLTGREIQRALLAAAEANPRIRLLAHHMAVDLLTSGGYAGRPLGADNRCLGAYVLDQSSGEIRAHTARSVLLACGGAGKVYLYTSNPDVATGDGIAMAYRAGAAIANMEFFQFHPTLLFHPLAKSFLISEALRGEGGVLRTADGHEFMNAVHEMGSLAPRDVVARTIDIELKRRGDECVYLDMTHLDGDFVRRRFPNIDSRCRELGIDMRTQPIPVVPGAHYCCGGVLVDDHGRTTVKNLIAAGEVTCTGLHGACRLASNSLLEALVFAARAARVAIEQDERASASATAADSARSAGAAADVAEWTSGSAVESDEAVVVMQNWDEIRRFMWNYVGIVRSDKRLERARRRIELIRDEIREYYYRYVVTSDLIELRNVALVGHLIVESARRRKESRGLHFNLDHPKTHESYRRDTVLSRVDGPSL